MSRVSEASCDAAALIIANRESGGELLRSLQAKSDKDYGELLATHLIQCEPAWKEEDLYKKASHES